MTKDEEERVTEIDRSAEEVAIPTSSRFIGHFACINGSLKAIHLEYTQIVIIEEYAFAYCHHLEEIQFPSCLEDICEGAFKQCRRLNSISFPSNSNLRKIGINAFMHCHSLEYFEFPPNLEFIGDFAFDYCHDSLILDLRITKVKHVGNIDSFYTRKIYLPATVSLGSVLNNYYHELLIDESHPIVKRDSCGCYFANGMIFAGKKDSKRFLIRRGVERIAESCFDELKLVSITIPSSVREICDNSFFCCVQLAHVRFTKDSRLEIIGKDAFSWSSIREIRLPSSLKIIKINAFACCKCLEKVVFRPDSRLERIEAAFTYASIKRLSLPPSLREIVDVCSYMIELESMFVSNEFYQSNEEGSAIYSKDGSELVCVLCKLKSFDIPSSVRVIKKRALFCSSITGRLIIPPSVEVIEEEAFYYCDNLEIIEFAAGSRLKSLAFDALPELKDLIINNDNFKKGENGVVMSMSPRGIVFVPSHLEDLEIPCGVEVIFSHAFYESRINFLKLPKSLKSIFSKAFWVSSLERIEFEEGTELDFIGNDVFRRSKIRHLKVPPIKGELMDWALECNGEIIEFPPNFKPRFENNVIQNEFKKIICPASSLPTVARFDMPIESAEFIITEE